LAVWQFCKHESLLETAQQQLRNDNGATTTAHRQQRSVKSAALKAQRQTRSDIGAATTAQRQRRNGMAITAMGFSKLANLYTQLRSKKRHSDNDAVKTAQPQRRSKNSAAKTAQRKRRSNNGAAKKAQCQRCRKKWCSEHRRSYKVSNLSQPSRWIFCAHKIKKQGFHDC